MNCTNPLLDLLLINTEHRS